ncbi:MAG: hypothetical protein AB7G93_19625 [Bdellovibrionales bacterium]
MLELLQKCEEDVRAGRGQHAAKGLARLNTAKIPRELLLSFANVARRAGLYNLGLRILASIVYPDRNKWHLSATAAELAEYSVLLQKVGAVGEALRILERVDTQAVPEAHLYRAFCYFSKWDYELAIPELESFLQDDLNPYMRLVGQVNLAAALVTTERMDEAQEILHQSIRLAEQGEFHRLRANGLELRAQTHIHQHNFIKAEDDLKVAQVLLGNERTLDELFVRKWKAILKALISGDVSPVRQFRAEAQRRSHWESVRECDLYLLKMRFENRLFHHLLVGTPFPAYRARILRELKQEIDPAPYIWGVPDSTCLDLSTGRMSDGSEFNPGKHIHRLLSALLKDLYRPMRLAGIFAELFPGEHFDVHSSPGRVHQILRRARQYFVGVGIPANIQQTGGNYHFEITGRFSVRLPFQFIQISGNGLVLERLKNWAQPPIKKEFTALEARTALGLSLTGFHRFMTWALNEGHLRRVGAGPRTRYFLVGDKPFRQAASAA